MSISTSASLTTLNVTSSLPTSATITIMGWFRNRQAVITNEPGTFAFQDTPAFGGKYIYMGWSYFPSPVQKVLLETSDGISANDYVGINLLSTGWIHFAYVKNNNSHKIYVTDPVMGLDASLEIDVTDSKFGNTTLEEIDTFLDSNNLPVNVAEVKIFTAALTQAQIRQERDSHQSVANTASLYSNAFFSVHTDLTDHSGHGHNWSVFSGDPISSVDGADPWTDAIFPYWKDGSPFVVSPVVDGGSFDYWHDGSPFSFTQRVTNRETAQAVAIGTSSAIAGGSTVVVSGLHVTLNPNVTYDGWSGSAISFLWTQVSGPATATIVSPHSQSTVIGFPDVTGSYLFQLQVSVGSFVSTALWRVAVYGSDIPVTPEDTSALTVTVNGVTTYKPQLRTTTIEKTRGDSPSTCQFDIFNVPITVGQTLIVTRAARLFKGVVMASVKAIVEKTGIWYTIQANSLSWFFTRRHVTRTWQNTSGTQIAYDLIALVPGFSNSGVELNLPTLVAFGVDDTVANALTKLSKALNREWDVDDNNIVHLSNFYDSTLDPSPLLEHPHSKFQDLKISTDISTVVTRVIVRGTKSSVNPGDPSQPFNGELEVKSLDGYNPAGGVATVGGRSISYTGVRAGYKFPFLLDEIFSLNFSQSASYNDPNGHMTGGETDIIYGWTWQSATGESGIIGTSAFMTVGMTDNAMRVKIVITALTTITANGIELVSGGEQLETVNIYRRDSGLVFRQVGSVPPGGGIILDTHATNDPDWDITKPLPVHPWDAADAKAFFLTGVTGIDGSIIPLGDTIPFEITVDDLANQSILANLIGGGDDGVVTDILEVGESTEDLAQQAGLAYLAQHAAVNVTAEYQTKDPKSVVGQVISVNLPNTMGVTEDFKIYQVTITGFEKGTPSEYHVLASKIVPLIKYMDLFRELFK